MARLKGWRFAVFMGGFVGAVLTPLYFTAFKPSMDPSYYQNFRKQVTPQLPPKSPYS